MKRIIERTEDGSATLFVPELNEHYDLRVYFDKPRQPLLWEMWDGKLVPFGFPKNNRFLGK